MRLHAILFDYYSFRLDFLRKVEGEPVNQSTGGVENPGQIPVFSNIRNDTKHLNTD